MIWSVGPFWYMVYGMWYVVYGMKMAFKVYSHMFHVHHARAVYNVLHVFLVSLKNYVLLHWLLRYTHLNFLFKMLNESQHILCSMCDRTDIHTVIVSSVWCVWWQIYANKFPFFGTNFHHCEGLWCYFRPYHLIRNIGPVTLTT